MVEDTDAIYGVYRERMLEAQKKHTAGAPGDHAGRMTNQTGTLWKSQGLPNRFVRSAPMLSRPPIIRSYSEARRA
jgi:hypothetical protein